MANSYNIHQQRSNVRGSLSLVLPLLALLFAPSFLGAQQYSSVGNEYIRALVTNSPGDAFGGGRFFMTAGSSMAPYKFLFELTSNVVFRIQSGSGVNYYSNARDGFGGQILREDGITPVPHLSFDSMYVSTDTIAVTWKKLDGYMVTMRLFPERVTSSYQRGGDMIIEFSYSFNPLAPPAVLGIFLMLDTYNGHADGSGGSGDKSAIITNTAYFPTDQPGKIFEAPTDVIPEFYHVGNFQAISPINTVLPIHRLTGTSHNGLPLTTPELFAVGNWRRFRFLSWEVTASDVGSTSLGDCATISRWGNLRGSGTIRTAYGLTDNEGNNLFHCRDSKIFVDIRTVRVIEQKEVDGNYSPTSFDVEMWVSNTSDAFLTANITMVTPIGAPTAAGRLILDPSTSQVQVIPLPVRATRKVRWRVNLVPGTDDELLDIPLDFRFQLSGTTGPPRVFRIPCTPVVTIKGFKKPPVPVDTMAPVIMRVTRERNPFPTWTFRSYDRHKDYLIDTGIDRVVVERNDNGNFSFQYTPIGFRRCDTTENLDIVARVTDTTKSAYLVYAVFDCQGNVSRDSAIYSPRPDIFKPQVANMVASGSEGPPCNARTYEFYLVDSLNQTPTAGDIGFSYASLSVIGALDNFMALDINFDRGNTPIRDFDARASFRLRVIDPMFNASATIRVVDYAGNDDTIYVNYCTLPDVKAPVSTVVPTPNPNPPFGPKQWTVNTSDMQAWDRGLDTLVVLDSSNVQLSSLDVTAGQASTSFTVDVIDEDEDARVTVEIRDRWYAAMPEGHADTVTLEFTKVPDVMAPNILFTPVAGTNGAVVDVEVNDIHYIGSDLYLYDRGLSQVNITSLTGNLKLVTMPVFSPADKQTTFRFAVIDTLSLSKYDTLCLEAIDLYGNRHDSCYVYPLQPDMLSPVAVGTMDAGRAAITGTIRDERAYDRGLGSVELINPVNLDPAAITVPDLAGTPTMPMMIVVVDPTKPFSGTLKVRDRVAQLEPTPETEAAHAVEIPFELPAVHLSLEMPLQVEGNDEIRAKLIALQPFPGRLVKRIAFTMNYSGSGAFARVQTSNGLLAATPGTGSVGIVYEPVATTDYQAGDELGTIVFTAQGTNLVGLFTVVADPASLVVNDNATSVFSAQKSGDPVISSITLPPPFARLVADSTTYINGVCDRILVGERTSGGKLNGLEILGLHPQPNSIGSGSLLQVDLRDLPLEGAYAEIIGPSGVVVSEFPLTGDGARVTRVPVMLPRDLASGLYVIRVRAGAAVTQAKVLVVE